ITAHDIRVLAQSNADDPVLAVDGDTVVVTARADVSEEASIVYSAEELNRELGPDITDVEAELLAGSLTAQLETS
ncbi:MAG TPA: hypothetical protein VGR21_05060, partial [Cryptosporangiaceae bacterium]|nr:hypothetical protein [Cryptosporangiaceae bacterium]